MLNLKLTAVTEEEFSLLINDQSKQKEIFEKLVLIFSQAQEIIPLYFIATAPSDKQRKLGSWHTLLKMIEGQNIILQYLLSHPLTQDRIDYLKSFKKLESDLDDRETLLKHLKNSNHERALRNLPTLFNTSFNLFKNHHLTQRVADIAFDEKNPQQEKALQVLRHLAKTIMQPLKICTLKDFEAPEMESDHQQSLANAYMLPNVMILRTLIDQFSET